MDESKIIFQVFEKYGWAGVAALYIFYDKIVRPQWRKRSGKHVSWESMNVKIDKLESTIAGHLEKEAIEDIKMAKFEVEQDHIKERLAEFSDNQKAMFQLISEIKTFLMQKGT